MADFSVLLGKTLSQVVGLEKESEEVLFHCLDGTRYRMYHAQDCCETVAIDAIEGDVVDIVGTPITRAHTVTSEDYAELRFESTMARSDGDSETWTFYKIDTAKGGIFIRWYGSSNGYYSESVDFVEMK